MPTRREVLVGAIAAGVIMRARTSFAKAAQPATPVNFDVPAGACDCHTHIHGDPGKFPYFAGRVYTPETALPEEMAALHARCGAPQEDPGGQSGEALRVLSGGGLR
jgi:hypothetical protein